MKPLIPARWAPLITAIWAAAIGGLEAYVPLPGWARYGIAAGATILAALGIETPLTTTPPAIKPSAEPPKPPDRTWQ